MDGDIISPHITCELGSSHCPTSTNNCDFLPPQALKTLSINQGLTTLSFLNKETVQAI